MDILNDLFESNDEIVDIINEYKEIEKIYEETLIAMGEKEVYGFVSCITNAIPLNIVSTKDY